jgi:hypothetical protein
MAKETDTVKGLKATPSLRPIVGRVSEASETARSKNLVKSSRKQWIELFPYAISMGAVQRRPILIFRDKSESLSLPIWLNQIEASIAALDLNKSTNLHALSIKLLESASIQIMRCEFIEIQGHHQFVRLALSGHPKFKELRVRADEAIPICMGLKARFFSTAEFIMQCRDLDIALLGIEQSLNLQPEIGSKRHPYMM